MRVGEFLRSITATLVLFGLAFRGAGGPVQIVSTMDATAPASASANGDSGLPIISHDGRFVLFASSANDLPVITNSPTLVASVVPRLNVFLRDRTNATTLLVSAGISGTGGGNGDSLPAGMSTNGAYVLFESNASDLVEDDTNSSTDVFIREIAAATTVLVSAGTNGGVGNGGSRSATMTPDGRYVAFVSAANNLVPDDTNGIPDVFLRDLQTQTTTLVSVGARTANRSSESPQITPDGRYVVYYSSAIGLLPGTTNYGDIYVRDTLAGTTIWASSYARTALQLFQNKPNAISFGHMISDDGQFVAYEVGQTTNTFSGIVLRFNLGSGATDVISTNAARPATTVEDTVNPVMTPDGRFIVFVVNVGAGVVNNTLIQLWDAQTGTNLLVSVGLDGAAPTNAICDWPAITPDGRFVAFMSSATNLVTNALAGEYHLFLRDMQTGVTSLLDTDTNGAGLEDGAMAVPRLSGDGRLTAFAVPDGSRVAGDINRNGDVFVRHTALNVTELISARDADLASVTPNGPSLLPALSWSGDGRYVVFVSDAENLFPNDTNGFRDVLVRDLLTGTNILISVDSNGISPANGWSFEPVISPDGRYVAFTSSADNIVPGDTNAAFDVFVRDLQTGRTVLASANMNGFGANRASSSPALSTDGHAVLLHSFASDLAVGSFGTTADNVFWRDLVANVTYAVSTNVTGPTSLAAAMTPDGRYVASRGSAGNSLWIWDSQSHTRIYTATLPNTLTNVAISPDGNRVACLLSTWQLQVVDRVAGTNFPIASAASRYLKFSADGRYLIYQTAGTNAPGDTNGLADIYFYDFQTSSNLLVSRAFDGAANGVSDSPDITPDGRFVAYRSAASNLVPNDLNGVPDVFVWDRTTGATLLLSAGGFPGTSANNRSLTPVFSGDGKTIAFASAASDLIAHDFNHYNDVFAYSLVSTNMVPLFRVTIVSGPNSPKGCWLTWPTVAGRTYRVQFKNDSADPTWQDLDNGVTIVGNQGWFNDQTVGIAQRLYRVVAQ